MRIENCHSEYFDRLSASLDSESTIAGGIKYDFCGN